MAKGTGCPSLVLANSKSVAVGVGEGLKKVKQRQGREIMGDRIVIRRWEMEKEGRRGGGGGRDGREEITQIIREQMDPDVHCCFPITLVVLRVSFPGIYQH